MAPTNGATGKPAQGGTTRSAGGPYKPVVPAIPLPYLIRQRKNQAAAAHVQAQSTSHAQSVPNQHPDQHHQVQAQTEESDTGNAYDSKQSSNTSPAITTPTSSETPSLEPEAVTPCATAAEVVAVSTDRAVTTPPAVPTTGLTETPQAQLSNAHVQQPVASPTPTRRHIPPAFHGFNNNAHLGQLDQSCGGSLLDSTAGDHNRLASGNSVHFHRAHPRHGSMIFNGMQGSNGSSPAPLSGGAVPPPNTMPYSSDVIPTPVLDSYGRPFMVSPAVDGFHPDGFPPDGFPPPFYHHGHPRHGPPTPHSFHGSQSSLHADENGYAPYQSANGHNVYPAHSTNQPPHHMTSMSMDQQSSAQFSRPRANHPARILLRREQQILDFLRGGIAHPEFSDCTLDVRLVHGHHERGSMDYSQDGNSLVIPCHRLILAQSPTLKHLFLTRNVPAGGRLTLELQDKYMRLDAFNFTLRTLYGWDLGSGALPSYHLQRDVKDLFNLFLGYAAAARYLLLPEVYGMAIQHACREVHWDTIEMACQFALPIAVFDPFVGHDMSAPPEAFGVSDLVDVIIFFLVQNIPWDFVLDSKAGDCGFSRLPYTSGPVSPSLNDPAVVQGTPGPQKKTSHTRQGSMPQAQMPRSSRVSVNPRLSSIRFGDWSLVNGNGANSGGHMGMSDALRSPSQAARTILSRILLNLPFAMLKRVLEHPALAKPSGELNMAARQKLISSVIAEREARRAAALDKSDPRLRIYLERLESAAAPLVVRQIEDFMVNSMGFKEEVFPGDVPYLVQTWVHGSGSASS